MLTVSREVMELQENLVSQVTQSPAPKENKENKVIRVTKENRVHLDLLVMMYKEIKVLLVGREHLETKENPEKRETREMLENQVWPIKIRCRG